MNKEIIKIYPSDDSYISQTSRAHNYGSDDSLVILGYSEYYSRAFLKFDIPEVEEVLSAKLFMYYCDNDISSREQRHYIKRVTTDWEEDTITYDKAPTFSGEGSLALNAYGRLENIGGTGVNKWRSVDITNLVLEWSTGVYPNYGLVLDHNYNSSYDGGVWARMLYRSKDYDDEQYRPYLELEFIPKAKSLIGIQLVNPPNKLTYLIGEALDLSGIKVMGSYDDDTTKEITINNSMVSGFNSSTNVLGQIVTITIKEFTVCFTVDIIKNKGEGRQIAIKFTDDLIGDVTGKGEPKTYKYYKWTILNTWSGSRLYLYELEFTEEGKKYDTSKISSYKASSQYSSSYSPSRLFDKSVPGTEWDANGSLPHTLTIELPKEITMEFFRWHTGTSGNKPKDFILEGSNDEKIWIPIYQATSPKEDNWIEFNVEESGNERAFSIEGEELYTSGHMVPASLKPYLVERYIDPILGVVNDTIILNFRELSIYRFHNWIGTIKVKYDSSKGNLSGYGGSVESFEFDFLPEGLEPNPHVWEENSFEVSLDTSLDLKYISFKDSYDANDNNIKVKLKALIDFIYTGGINP